jgi:opacity protein-like surface antigen
MKFVRNIVVAIAAGSALSLGAAAFAQDAKQPEAAKPEAKEHQHRGGAGQHGHNGMHRMGEMRGGCHSQS